LTKNTPLRFVFLASYAGVSRHGGRNMTDIALLAPVPLEHLEDGIDICRKQGKVAFGSRAWEIFRELDALRNGRPISAFI
jgi:hypothetical protein